MIRHVRWTRHHHLPLRAVTAADELYKYMQMVDDTARQVDEAPSSSAARRELNASEDGVDDAGELPGGGGGGDSRPFGYSQVGNSPGQPPHRNTKSDPQKIKPFAGLCRIAPESVVYWYSI